MMSNSHAASRLVRSAIAFPFRLFGGVLSLAGGLLGSPWSLVLDHDRNRRRRARRA